MQDPNNPDDNDLYNEFDDFGDFDDNSTDGGDTFQMPDESGYGEGAGDEFGADESYGDFGSDEFGDGSGDDGWGDDEQNGAPPKAKRGGLPGLSFNTIVIGAAVLVGAGVLVYQVMNSKPAMDGADRFQSALNFTGATDGPVFGRESEDAQAGQQIPDDAGPGFLDNPDVLNNLERETAEQNDALPMPAPISNEADDLGMDQTSLLAGAQPNPVLTPMPSVEDGVQFEPSQQVPRGPDSGAASAESAAPSGTTALDMIRQAQQQRENRQNDAQAVPSSPAPAVSDPAALAVTPPVTASAPASAANVTDDSAELRAELTAANNRAAALEKELAALRSGSSDQVAELEREVARLQGEVQQARQAAKEAGDKAESAAASKSASAPASTPAPKAAAPAKSAAAPKPKAAPAPARQASAAPARGAVEWELRAAQPGRAWVSRKGQREMQSIEAGDSLAGIGQIMRIEYASGRWTVFGTQGTIRQ